MYKVISLEDSQWKEYVKEHREGGVLSPEPLQ
jgi:hypothetical protein